MRKLLTIVCSLLMLISSVIVFAEEKQETVQATDPVVLSEEHDSAMTQAEPESRAMKLVKEGVIGPYAEDQEQSLRIEDEDSKDPRDLYPNLRDIPTVESQLTVQSPMINSDLFARAFAVDDKVTIRLKQLTL